MLLIAKLNAYRFCLKALKLMNNSQENQRTKTNESYSSLEKIIFGVTQGSVLRHILFIVFLNISHFSISFIVLILNDIDFASYNDDNTLYNLCDNVDVVAETLGMLAENLIK